MCKCASPISTPAPYQASASGRTIYNMCVVDSRGAIGKSLVFVKKTNSLISKGITKGCGQCQCRSLLFITHHPHSHLCTIATIFYILTVLYEVGFLYLYKARGKAEAASEMGFLSAVICKNFAQYHLESTTVIYNMIL